MKPVIAEANSLAATRRARQLCRSGTRLAKRDAPHAVLRAPAALGDRCGEAPLIASVNQHIRTFQRPVLRPWSALGNLLVDLVEHPDDPDVIEQTITDIERFFGPAT